MKKYLAIFDLDGTLFDTSEVNYHAYKEALKPYGIELERDYFLEECFGRHYLDFLPVIMGGRENMEAVHSAKTRAYGLNLDKAKVNRHLFRIIDSMRGNYYTAIVTTASRKNTTDVLRHFGYLDYFDYVATQEDIVKKKPDPEGFLSAMDHFGIDAEHTVIFEDSEIGIEAGRATGASVFVVDRMR